MQQVKTLSQNQYPVIYEDGKETAVVVDIKSFQQIQLILDNLLNREQEPEDAIVAEAHILWQRMIQKAQAEDRPSDWVAELYDL
ncbi:MAG: hypothetical protein HND44_17305 [Chloroflexi bacterium]|nr:hypothetical protein [Ardenticatenaceae bacterium]MBL1130211.1 hypothetical protein [Chloroflexota bacterium]NOG36302.1 hypothetical protein [Chloroflexota bacterium]GIK58368.1 MAG: hypothetical protein BroJett015_40310 [Chloroflexota bacterium]